MKLKGLFILDERSYRLIYPQWLLKEYATRIDLIDGFITAFQLEDHAEQLAQADILLSGWGCPLLDETMMAAMPNLKLVLYGAGSIKYFQHEAFWKRDIPVCSAWAANAVPVTEFALAQILLACKKTLPYYRNCNFDAYEAAKQGPRDLIPGGYRSTVGLVSLGMIGRKMVELLKPFDIQVIAYDPFMEDTKAAELGVEMVDLQTLFTRSDVVSLHTPWLKETEGLITGELIASMKPYATLLNTSRGAVVDELAMLDVLGRREDLTAVLDVVYPEPPASDSLVWQLPNVFYTPHIAGSLGPECARMGYYMLEELDRYLAGEPLKWSVSEQASKIMA